MKRIAWVYGLLLCIFLGTAPTSIAAETPNLTEDAKSAVLLERDTGQILYKKNLHEELPPASMTKIMTLLLIMEAIDQNKLALDESITISENASSMGGSQVFLETGETMKVDDLVKAVAIASGNDASVALAERIAGSEEAFVKRMNEKVEELGLKHTKFQNTTGLPAEDHYSTAYDMAIIAKELLHHEKITKYTSIYEDYLRKGKENEFWLVNTNKLIHFYPYVDGLKTGYTSEAKFCLTATAKKEEMRLVAVVMGADTVKDRNKMTMNMIDYGFHTYEIEKLFDKGEQVAELRDIRSEDLVYPVVTSDQVSILHKKGEQKTGDITPQINLDESYTMPMKQGTEIGNMQMKHKSDIVHESPLIVQKPMKNASFLTLFSRALKQMANYSES